MGRKKEREEKLSLRAIKQAKLKLAIANAFIAKLKHLSFKEVNIKALCKELEISEGTFFNHFREKIEVVSYYISLTTLKIIYEVSIKSPRSSFVDTINVVFDKLADEISSPNMANITYELISIIMLQHEKPKKVEISALEKKLAFPDLKGIEKVKAMLLDEFLLEAINNAIRKKEIKKQISAEDLLIALICVMIGTLIAIKFRKNLKLKDYYRRHLNILWNELGIKK